MIFLVFAFARLSNKDQFLLVGEGEWVLLIALKLKI